MNKLHYDINELEQQYSVLYQTLEQYINQLENKVFELQSFSDDKSSTSISLLAIKEKIDDQAITNLKQMIDVFREIQIKLNYAREYYSDYCGNISLDEEDLLPNIEYVKRTIDYYEDLEYSLRLVPELNVIHDVEQIKDQLHELLVMYQQKLDGMYLFEDSIRHLFTNEIEELKAIQANIEDMNSISENGIFDLLAITMSIKTNEGELTGQEIQAKLNSMSLEEQEKLIGISYEDFKSIYTNQFGFNEEEIEMIWKVNAAIHIKYPDSNEADRMFNLLMGIINYDDWKWTWVAGKNEITDPINYMTKELGFSNEFARQINYKVRLHQGCQNVTVNINEKDPEKVKNFLNNYLNGTIDEESGQLLIKKYSEIMIDIDIDDIAKDMANDIITNGSNSQYYQLWLNCCSTISNMQERTKGKSDFSHQMIIAATLENKNLNPSYKNDAKWQGDVFGVPLIEADPSMNEGDYIADLDAENIKTYKDKFNCTYAEAMNKYYNDLSVNSDIRVDTFVIAHPEYLDECFLTGLDNYCFANNIPLGIPTPYPAPVAQSDYTERIREEYMKLPDEEKIEYLEPQVKNFVCCLKTKSPTYKDFSNVCPVF